MEILAMYWYLFKWQFTEPWFYAWIAFIVGIGWGKPWKQLAMAIAICVFAVPIATMLIKFDVLFGK